MGSTTIAVWSGRDDSELCEKLGQLDGAAVIVPEDEKDVENQLINAEVFITSSAIWSEDFSRTLYESKKIRWVQLMNAGYDNVLKAGVPEEVIVSTIGGIGADMVADHAIALLYAILRRIPEAIKREGEEDSGFESIAGNAETLNGKTMAVLGYGNIGKIIARNLTCLGAEVKAVARTGRHDEDLGISIEPVSEIHTVLETTDGLVICCPLSDETEKLIDNEALACTKDDYYIVNVSRGGIVDTESLVNALKNNQLGGAALDVTDPEPLPPDHPLRGFANVVISPHVAWAGGGARFRKDMEDLIIRNVRNYMRNEQITNKVDRHSQPGRNRQ